MVGAFAGVTALANEGSIRRNNIIVLDGKRNAGLILNPPFQFENCEQQLKLANEKKDKQ